MKIFFFLFSIRLFAVIYPIEFAVPEVKVVDQIPEKTKEFAHIIPGVFSTYIYESEEDYYKDYQSSFFAYTWKKAGWDCMRHYEILANGCIPYFRNLEDADSNTMFLLPRDLILEAMNLPGVSEFGIDFSEFDQARYDAILKELLDYTRKHLTTRALAEYVLKTVGYSGEGKILYLSENLGPDYMRCTLLVGLKEALGAKVVDVPQIPHIYKGYPDPKNLYGKGFTYSCIVEEEFVDRENILDRILNKEFEFVIYGSVHRGLPFLDWVKLIYSPDEIFYVCGEDAHACEYKDLPHLFLREAEAAY